MRQFCLFLPFVVSGCVEFTSTGTGEFAVSFDGATSCIEAESNAALLGGPTASFTVEAWVRSTPEPAYEIHPLVVWNGAFALWSGPEGEGHFTDSSNDMIGADGTRSWMDGELHHVAGTYDDGTATLFLDGEIIAFNTSTVLADDPTGAIHIGCWDPVSVHHDGLIDEVRLSDSVRYTEDFVPAREPFTKDDETIHLWHFDEGEDVVGLDEATLSDAFLTNVDWVEFSLLADDTAGR